MELLEPLRKGEGKVQRTEGKEDRWLALLECLRDITEGKVRIKC